VTYFGVFNFGTSYLGAKIGQNKTMTKISRFTVVVGSNNCIYVWRKGDEVNRPNLVCRPSQRKVSVMIWGCLSFNGIKTLTENNLWPVIARYFAVNEYVFQDDNAPVHRAQITKNYKQENNINCSTWPAQSPDLNKCENVWLRIKRALQPIAENINTQNEYNAEIRRVWESLPVNYIQGLYQTIPTWIREVTRMKGHLTKY
jgi:hypothetical protein